MKEEIEEEDEYEPDQDAQRFIIEPNPNSLWNRFKRWIRGTQT